MRVTRIHVPTPLVVGSEAALPTQAAEHLTRVLRLAPGAALTLFDGRGGEYSANLAGHHGRSVHARVVAHDPVERESPLALSLLQGVARGERMDFIVQKATELGVIRIVPVLTERSVVRVDPSQRERKRAHWQQVAISACEQCGRNRVPQVDSPLPLDQALAAAPEADLRCLLAAGAAETLVEVAGRQAAASFMLLVGPEGGLTDLEARSAQQRGFVGCRLGPRVLRTETAGLAALVTLQAVAGDLAR